MRNYVQPGNVVTLTAPAALSSGDGVLVGDLFGVASFDAASGAPVECAIVGVYRLPKETPLAISQGAAVYWDDAAKVITTTAGGNTLIGNAITAATSAATHALVRLSG